MSEARNEALTLATQKQIDAMDEMGRYHSVELPTGEILPGHLSVDRLRNRLAQYQIPADLHGKRVLDIGAWDGFYTFEMERRGAQVVALDLVSNPTFLATRDLMKSRAEYVVGDICRLSRKDLGVFDIVLFFGVLYHVKHPQLALENVCSMTADTACVESYVIDDPPDLNAAPILEFYEHTELRGRFDNWVGPNVSCLMAMARTAGFAEVEFESVISHRAHVTCRRKWSSTPGNDPAPEITCIENTVTRDHDFSALRDDYVSIYFRTGIPGLTRGNVYIEIGPYAAPVAGLMELVEYGNGNWHAVCSVPLGLEAQWHQVRLRVRQSQWSNSVRIPVDLPAAEDVAQACFTPVSSSLRVDLVTDGTTWDRWRVNLGPGSGVSIWAMGIPDGAQKREVTVLLNGLNLPCVYLSEPDAKGLRQVNA